MFENLTMSYKQGWGCGAEMTKTLQYTVYILRCIACRALAYSAKLCILVMYKRLHCEHGNGRKTDFDGKPVYNFFARV